MYYISSEIIAMELFRTFSVTSSGTQHIITSFMKYVAILCVREAEGFF